MALTHNIYTYIPWYIDTCGTTSKQLMELSTHFVNTILHLLLSGAQSVEVRERDVSCPVCYNIIISPIMQCGEGHLICKECLGHLAPLRCPTCREAYPADAPARNRALEQLVAQLMVSCYDCRHGFKARDRDEHNAVCPARPIDCPFTGCRAKLPLCDLPGHLRDEHGRCGLSTTACQNGPNDSLG